jgi:hypothetical protein
VTCTDQTLQACQAYLGNKKTEISKDWPAVTFTKTSISDLDSYVKVRYANETKPGKT